MLAEPSRSGIEPRWRPSPRECESALREVRAKGWALTDEQLALGIRSVAAPLRTDWET
ncbi:IclR family transcriptional regulator domain-containing protein [Sphaerimonospora mesophila]|uniref:IclR family transcriptional regulator domain-containing protein n=1 Tax=Sphaerimonospora mesophila TaxID=37483 RepID=UPI000AA59B02